jgi:hypothetical protein
MTIHVADRELFKHLDRALSECWRWKHSDDYQSCP